LIEEKESINFIQNNKTMKVLEALVDEISRQKKIDALMKLKQQKEAELKEIRYALRLTIRKAMNK
jgi:hypothetical protein